MIPNSSLTLMIDYIQNEKDWKNKSRIIGEACEKYVQDNIKCFRCFLNNNNKNNFNKCKVNEKSKDFICVNCNQKYQVKAKGITNKSLNKIIINKTCKILGGEYKTTLNSLNQNIDYLIVLYDKTLYSIKKYLYVKYEQIDSNCILARKPLSVTARRSGWTGCYVLLKNFDIIL